MIWGTRFQVICLPGLTPVHHCYVILEMVGVHSCHGASRLGTMMSHCLVVHTLHMSRQGLLAFEQDATDVTGNNWGLMQCFNMLLQAIVVSKCLATICTVILLTYFCQQ